MQKTGVRDLSKVLEDLDDGKRRAGQYGFLGVLRVEEADVLVHVEDVLMGETFNVFVDGDDLLQVLVLSVAEDGVVDYYAVNDRIVIGVDDGLFDCVFFALSECVLETTGLVLVRVDARGVLVKVYL